MCMSVCHCSIASTQTSTESKQGIGRCVAHAWQVETCRQAPWTLVCQAGSARSLSHGSALQDGGEACQSCTFFRSMASSSSYDVNANHASSRSNDPCLPMAGPAVPSPLSRADVIEQCHECMNARTVARVKHLLLCATRDLFMFMLRTSPNNTAMAKYPKAKCPKASAKVPNRSAALN